MKSRKALLLLQLTGIFLLCGLVIYMKPNFDITKISKTTSIDNKVKTPTNKEVVSNHVTSHNKKLAFDGFTLIANSGDATTKLIDMTGKIINQWKVDAERARLLTNGNLLVLHGSKWGKDRSPWRELRNTIREYDWDGNIVLSLIHI